MKKLRKNKFLVLAICTIIVSLIYFAVQKAIDNYVFKSNSDIVVDDGLHEEDENISETGSLKLEGDLEDASSINDEQFSNEELDLILEETEDNEIVANVNEAEEYNSKGQNASINGINQSKIYVYITGEVNQPGVVILKEGSRIVDAINAAGGTTANANISKVNLVYVLEDGMKVNIPSNNDLKNDPDFEYITMNSGDGGKDDYSSEQSDKSSKTELSSKNSSNYSMVNINTATQTELETLPGIGPSLALKIINYRKENGKFSSIDEIKNVSGIGEARFENLIMFIRV